MGNKEKQVTMAMLQKVQERIRNGTPWFGDHGLVKMYQAKLGITKATPQKIKII